jgi:Fic family protein
MIFWRRRLPGRAATIFGRSHLTFSLRTRDPRRARQLSRRLAVHFDEIFDAMEQVTRALTNEQREAILQSFRDLIRERIELRELISSAPSEAQQIERVRNAPRSLEELNTLFAGEEAFLAADPTARAVYEERRAAHEAIAELGNLDEPTVRDLEFLQPTVTGDAWNAKHRPWRREDAPDLGFGSSEQLRSPVPARFVFQSVEGWMREFQGPCWVGVHPLVWIAIAHVEFIRISPFLRGNRRTGRILFEALLYRSGWPVLPWQLGFERHRDDYLDALLASFTKRSYQPVAEFVLRLFEPVLAAGQRMLDILPTERARLEAAIAEEPFAGTSEREYAEALLGQVLVEGFGWGLENNRGLLKRLHAQGLVDVIRTPAGAVFSSSIARGLLRQNDAS